MVDGEDFLLMPCASWSDESRARYEKANKDLNFFATSQLRQFQDTVHEFVQEHAAEADVGRRKVGRNEPCPCGSGRKFKRCHGKDSGGYM